MNTFDAEVARRVIEAATLRIENVRLRNLLRDARPFMRGTWATRCGSRCVCPGCEEVRDLHTRIDAVLNPSAAPAAGSEPSGR